MTRSHDVRTDVAGWGNHPRLTCYSKGCNGATLVRQPFMDEARWRQECDAFLALHPRSTVIRNGEIMDAFQVAFKAVDDGFEFTEV